MRFSVRCFVGVPPRASGVRAVASIPVGMVRHRLTV